MREIEDKQLVLVTGGTGYLAGWTIVGLLRRGFRVRTTLRDLGKQTAVRAAVEGQVGEVGDRLTFAKADLLDEKDWMRATHGCRYVLHLASPMGQGAPKGTDLVGPARDGSLHVLAAAAANGVERAVLTSSGFAAQTRTVPGEQQSLADEETWTDLGEKGIGQYARSKVLAERAAWDFIRGDASGMTLATVLPGLILGASMTRQISPSLELVARLLGGRVPALPHVGFCVVHVQDIVDLHLRAMTQPEAANQRFLGTGDFLWLEQIAQTLKAVAPRHAANIPSRRVPDWVMRVSGLFQEQARFMVPMLGKRRTFAADKARTLLQWHARPPQDAVIDCATSLIELGIV